MVVLTKQEDVLIEGSYPIVLLDSVSHAGADADEYSKSIMQPTLVGLGFDHRVDVET
jgi:hypothetical protein